MDEEAWEYYRDNVKTYNKLLCEWEGKVYAFVQDGDAAILYYRKDVLNDPEKQEKFKAKYGYELPSPPKIWDQIIDVAEFFDGWGWDNDGKNLLNPGTFAGSGGPELKEKFGYALWPATYHEGKAIRYDPVFFGRIMGISRLTEHPEAAFAVLKEINKPKRKMLHLSNTQSGTDIFTKTALDIDNWDINIDPQFIKTYLSALEVGVPDIMIPSSEQYYRAMGTQIQKYLGGEQDAKTTLTNIESEWEKITDNLGRETQRAAWDSYVEKMLSLGFRF